MDGAEEGGLCAQHRRRMGWGARDLPGCMRSITRGRVGGCLGGRWRPAPGGLVGVTCLSNALHTLSPFFNLWACSCWNPLFANRPVFHAAWPALARWPWRPSLPPAAAVTTMAPPMRAPQPRWPCWRRPTCISTCAATITSSSPKTNPTVSSAPPRWCAPRAKNSPTRCWWTTATPSRAPRWPTTRPPSAPSPARSSCRCTRPWARWALTPARWATTSSTTACPF